MSYLLIAVLAAVIFAAGGAAGIKWHAGQDAIIEVKRLEAVKELNRENALLANRTSTTFEVDRTKNEVRTRTIMVEVDKIVDRPIYRNVCLDTDGLQQLNAAIRRNPTASEPSGPVPRPITPK